jgi:hypothetical protein
MVNGWLSLFSTRSMLMRTTFGSPASGTKFLNILTALVEMVELIPENNVMMDP